MNITTAVIDSITLPSKEYITDHHGERRPADKAPTANFFL